MATEIEGLKKEIDTLKEDLKGVMKSVKDFTSQKFDDSKDLKESSIEEIKKAIEELKSRGKDGVECVNDAIKSDPFKSIGVTFAIGFLAGWLLKK